jgi:hypothetical protein
MKKVKDPNAMMTTKSKSRLSVFNSGVYDDRGWELVISCGYSIGNQFGYFICKEKASGNPLNEVYEYTDAHSFHPKENEKTYAKVLEEMKLAVKSYGGQLK